MEANAVIWIWNYISFMLHYHFMVVMTVRRWNIYRLFRRHLSNTSPEGHLGLKIHYPFVKLCPESQFLSQPIRTLFPTLALNVWMTLPSCYLTDWPFILEVKEENETMGSGAIVCEMGTWFLPSLSPCGCLWLRLWIWVYSSFLWNTAVASI